MFPKKQKPVLKADITPTGTSTVLQVLMQVPQPTVRQVIHTHPPAHIPSLAMLALPAVRVRLLVLTTTGSHSSVDQQSETQLCKEMQ